MPQLNIRPDTLENYQVKQDANLLRRVANIIASINDDITTLENAPTNAEVLQILRRVLVKQKRLIRVVAKLYVDNN